MGQGGPLKALGHLAAQPVGVLDALEEDGVLANALDAKGVVDGPHSCAIYRHLSSSSHMSQKSCICEMTQEQTYILPLQRGLSG